MRVVLDPGVLIAAAISPRGICGHVLTAAIDRRYTLVTSATLLAELGEVLLRSKFRRYFSEDEARRYVAHVAEVSTVEVDPAPQSGFTPDPGDDYLVALARQAGADYLVSGDPHLTGIAEPRPPILTPRGLLERLDQESAEPPA